MSYTLDTNSARKADQRGAYINETGKYIGKLTRAEDIKTTDGAKGIDFSFVANDGRRTRFSVYTVSKQGERINSGHGFVMALMTCLGVRSMEPQQTKVKKYDFDTKSEVDATVPCYRELMGRDIGLLLEKESFTKSNGQAGERMLLAGVFQAGTELTASEILDRKTHPEQLGKLVDTLRDRVARPQGGRPAASGSVSRQSSGGLGDMDDDIPF
ncbi:MAG: hypothetical protein HY856_13375 [Burkholderiales bacterium]|nr:hypothetical protein [Burkholderiales bacterium]